MDPLAGPSRPLSSGVDPPPRWQSSNVEILREESNTGSRGNVVGTLRRGHSDQEIMVAANGLPNERQMVPTARGGETWQDFLRQIPNDGGDDVIVRRSAAVRKAAMLAKDQKRWADENRAEISRSRHATMLPPQMGHFGSGSSSRTGESGGEVTSHENAHSNSVVNVERPLPRTLSTNSMQQMPNMDNILPRWQPDAEASECPICGRAFAFFYRKHHCRKCGRVVCANCSPHRITIPRQFIVRPPEEMLEHGLDSNASPEIIDLTGDSNEQESTTQLLRSSPSSEGQLDPALGGGQEVRLCNPCVPDPHPLPPPSYRYFENGMQSNSPSYRLPRIDMPPPPTYSATTAGQTPSTHRATNVSPALEQPSNLVHRSQSLNQPNRSIEATATSTGSRYQTSTHHNYSRRYSAQNPPASSLPGSPYVIETLRHRRAMNGPSNYSHLASGSYSTEASNSDQTLGVAQGDGSYSAQRNHWPTQGVPQPVGSSSGANNTGTSRPRESMNAVPDFQTWYGSAPGSSAVNYFMKSMHSSRPPANYSHGPNVSTGQMPTHARHTSLFDFSAPHGLPSSAERAPFPPTFRHLPASPPPPTPPPPLTPPPPQIAEEDECPVCHCELPPKGPEDSETDREAHVSSCIESNFSSSGPKSTQPHPAAVIGAAVAASSSTPTQAGASSSSVVRPEATARRRTTGMVVYQASEKDCVGEDGNLQECVICFEEFEPGDEMGRLECLCKYHKTCIRRWWDTKGVGACPVHVLRGGQ